MTENPDTGTTLRIKSKKGKQKRSKASIQKQIETFKKNKAAKEKAGSQPDVTGAIMALRAARREIWARACKGDIKDLGDVEINVFIALRNLQGR